MGKELGGEKLAGAFADSCHKDISGLPEKKIYDFEHFTLNS
jgi:hypothetical protein